MPIDPVKSFDAIRDNYLSYLSHMFRLREPTLREHFLTALHEQDKFVKGPMLEATPPYQTGKSINELIEEGILVPSFLRLLGERLPGDRPLYLHQEKAIRKAVLGRNLVIASGTGSGKTESFLIPILNSLLGEAERGGLDPGVRALLLYPMNALANDQLARLRGLLKSEPQITFGRYTGETLDKRRDARDAYLKMFEREPLKNELVSREEMLEAPPHILLTNYAMLEYLLLRPRDSVFFDGPLATKWRFLVLDEVHTYPGARGIEMSMLLRRLKDRAVGGRKGVLQCFATSATLGRERADFGPVAEFAENLFDEEFCWQDDDTAMQDVIGATRKTAAEITPAGALWTADPGLYPLWAEIARDHSRNHATVLSLADAGLRYGIPATLVQKAIRDADGDLSSFLHQTMSRDRNLATLRGILQDGTKSVSTIAENLWPSKPAAVESLIALVDLACRARTGPDESPLLPARYHIFVRAIEGAYVRLGAGKEVYLERRDRTPDGAHPVFEVGTCRDCGALYIIGKINKKDDKNYLEQSSDWSAASNAFLVPDPGSGVVENDEDEDASFVVPSRKQTPNQYTLCTCCGAISPSASTRAPCVCGSQHYVTAFDMGDYSAVHRCPSCGKRNPGTMVFPFSVGIDASAAVLATALYQNIIPPAEQEDVSLEPPDDEWATPRVKTELQPGGGKLLAFSDSRQDAAFFGPYFDSTYNQIVRRSLLTRVVEENRGAILANKWRLADLVAVVVRLAEARGLFPTDASPQQRQTEVWKWVLREFLMVERRTSIESLGFFSFAPVKPIGWSAPRALLQAPWNLSGEEAWTLMRVLLDTLRTRELCRFQME